MTDVVLKLYSMYNSYKYINIRINKFIFRGFNKFRSLFRFNQNLKIQEN